MTTTEVDWSHYDRKYPAVSSQQKDTLTTWNPVTKFCQSTQCWRIFWQKNGGTGQEQTNTEPNLTSWSDFFSIRLGLSLTLFTHTNFHFLELPVLHSVRNSLKIRKILVLIIGNKQGKKYTDRIKTSKLDFKLTYFSCVKNIPRVN